MIYLLGIGNGLPAGPYYPGAPAPGLLGGIAANVGMYKK